MSTHRLIFFGSSEHSARLLTDVLRQDWCEIVAVVTRPAPQQGHRHQADTPVVAIAEAAGIPVWRPHHPDDAIADIQAAKVSAGLLFAYGKILSDALIAAFPQGIINVHPSLLPRHRGPSPIEATILSGDTEAGTTIMLITREMDSGPILQQARFPIVLDISKKELWEKLYQASLSALSEAAPAYLAGDRQPHSQPETGVSYCKLVRKTDGAVDLNAESAISLERKIRAYADWPKVRIPIRLNTTATELILLAAKLDSHTCPTPRLIRQKHTTQLCLPDGSLSLIRVQLPGRQPIDGADLANVQSLELA